MIFVLLLIVVGSTIANIGVSRSLGKYVFGLRAVLVVVVCEDLGVCWDGIAFLQNDLSIHMFCSLKSVI